MFKKCSRIALALLLASGTGMAASCSSEAAANEAQPSSTQPDAGTPPGTPGEGNICPPGHDDAPGRGRTAAFEIAYLRFIIDHHFGALRMSELAAGTDRERTPEITEAEGTTLSPGFEPVEAKARLPELRSLARRNNRMQREEIVNARDMLQEWYGIDHQPQIPPDARMMITELEALPPGEAFDRQFIEMFSRHHFTAVVPSVECQVSRELEHQTLETFCRNIVVGQVSDIQDMRHWDCDNYGRCDLQPVERSQIPALVMPEGQ